MKKSLLFFVMSSLLLFGENIPNPIKENGCLECHNVRGKKTAPGFKGIAKKHTLNSIKEMKNSIKNGSSGKYRKFKEFTMPPYNHITEKELDRIAKWILTL